MDPKDLKETFSPEYQRHAEDLGIWRQRIISLLPKIRSLEEEARAHGHLQSLNCLEAAYQQLLEALSFSGR